MTILVISIVLFVISFFLVGADLIYYRAVRNTNKAYTEAYEGLNKALVDADVSFVKKDWTRLSHTGTELDKAFLKALQKMYEKFLQKNHDYGTNNLAMGWLPGIVLRKSDKLSRMWQLSGMRDGDSVAHVSDESLTDTFLDDANYSVVGYLMTAGAIQPVAFDDNVGQNAKIKVLAEQLRILTDEGRAQLASYLLAMEIAQDIDGEIR